MGSIVIGNNGSKPVIFQNIIYNLLATCLAPHGDQKIIKSSKSYKRVTYIFTTIGFYKRGLHPHYITLNDN